jgi:hypothetical protein
MPGERDRNVPVRLVVQARLPDTQATPSTIRRSAPTKCARSRSL